MSNHKDVFECPICETDLILHKWDGRSEKAIDMTCSKCHATMVIDISKDDDDDWSIESQQMLSFQSIV